MRKSIDGLAAIVQQQFHLDPFSNTLFYSVADTGIFVLQYKRLENGSFKWPREESELKPITWQQFRWLMEGLQVEQKQSIHPAVIGDFC